MIKLDDHGACARLAKSMKTEAKKLQPELANATVKSADEIKRNIRKAAASILPKRGGLAAEVARMTFRVDRKANGCRIQASSPYHIERMNGGIVIHPVYGNPKTRVDQSIKPGFWDTAVKESEPAVRREVQRATDELAARIEKG